MQEGCCGAAVLPAAAAGVVLLLRATSSSSPHLLLLLLVANPRCHHFRSTNASTIAPSALRTASTANAVRFASARTYPWSSETARVNAPGGLFTPGKIPAPACTGAVVPSRGTGANARKEFSGCRGLSILRPSLRHHNPAASFDDPGSKHARRRPCNRQGCARRAPPWPNTTYTGAVPLSLISTQRPLATAHVRW